MQTETVFHEDVFYEYFQPNRHVFAHFDIWGGLGSGHRLNIEFQEAK